MNLYVADFFNDRIQCFRLNQLNGSTVTGNGASGTITLFHPIDVVVDADGYLFIFDCGNYRVIQSELTGFRCIIGCTGTSGSRLNQLKGPHSFSFDSYGNLFVTDNDNARVQKFALATNS